MQKCSTFLFFFFQGLNGISGEKGAAGNPGDKGQKGDTGHPGVDVFQTVKVSVNRGSAQIGCCKSAYEIGKLKSKNVILKFLQISNQTLCSALSAFSQGLKRSVTTLHGGTLGYAEIVAVKVFFSHKYVSAAVL